MLLASTNINLWHIENSDPNTQQSNKEEKAKFVSIQKGESTSRKVSNSIHDTVNHQLCEGFSLSQPYRMGNYDISKIRSW